MGLLYVDGLLLFTLSLPITERIDRYSDSLLVLEVFLEN